MDVGISISRESVLVSHAFGIGISWGSLSVSHGYRYRDILGIYACVLCVLCSLHYTVKLISGVLLLFSCASEPQPSQAQECTQCVRLMLLHY